MRRACDKSETSWFETSNSSVEEDSELESLVFWEGKEEFGMGEWTEEFLEEGRSGTDEEFGEESKGIGGEGLEFRRSVREVSSARIELNGESEGEEGLEICEWGMFSNILTCLEQTIVLESGR